MAQLTKVLQAVVPPVEGLGFGIQGIGFKVYISGLVRWILRFRALARSLGSLLRETAATREPLDHKTQNTKPHELMKGLFCNL